MNENSGNYKIYLKYLNEKKLIILKMIFIIILLFYNNKLRTKQRINPIDYNLLNITKYKETIELNNGGILEIYKNSDTTMKMETKSGKINKSEIIFLIMPGGSYLSLAKHENIPIAKKFFSIGYSSAVLLYSRYPSCYPNSYNQGLQSIKLLSERYKKVVLIGFSAGAHLTGLLGTTEREKLYNTCAMILCYPVISFSKKAHEKSRMNFFGKILENNEENRNKFSIENRVNSYTLPTFIWTVKTDKVVPYENSLYMIYKLKENHVEYKSIIFENGKHGMGLADKSVVLYGRKEFENKEVAKWFGQACDFVENIIKNF